MFPMTREADAIAELGSDVSKTTAANNTAQNVLKDAYEASVAINGMHATVGCLVFVDVLVAGAGGIPMSL